MPAPGIRFRVPPPRRALVERARLVRRLPTSPDRMPRLLLLAAPAGFGKTTLLTQWLGSLGDSPSPPAVAWMAVDTSDADVRQFLGDLVAAIEAATGLEIGVRSLLDARASIEDARARLVAALDEWAAPLIIVLDDLHAADTPAVHGALTFLLDHLPATMTVAMTTRADPSLPLARMRARGELLELRAADLRFTRDEASEFLSDIMDLELSDGQVEVLEARTEGWPAGLQLAALSARTRAGEDEIEEFVRDFAGSHRFVMDYLLDEVLAGEEEVARAYLMHTAVLDQLSGALCDAVTGRDDSQSMLESLERRNLFVVPLDDERRWYRYHHLFADALRARLLAESPSEASELHRRASLWFASEGLLANAVRHAREAGDDGLSAYVIEAAISELRQQRRDQTIIDWVGALPDELVRARPLLATTRAWAHLASGELDRVADWLTAAEQASGTDVVEVPLPPSIAERRRAEIRLVPGTVAIYRASLAQAAGDVAATVEHATRARDLALPEDHLLQASAAGFLGLTDWVAGDLESALARFADTRRHLEAAGNVADALATAVPVTSMLLELGRPDQARRMLEQVLTTADGGPALASHADLHVALADVLRVQGDLQSAQHHLDAARSLGPAASLPENRFRWYAVRADLLAAAGDLKGALEMLDRAEELYLPGFFPDVRPLGAQRDRILLLQKPVGEPPILTDREFDVLRLLDSDLTGPEIAARLFVSINTLRTHTRRLFTKLDVTTRRAAVLRARDRGIL